MSSFHGFILALGLYWFCNSFVIKYWICHREKFCAVRPAILITSLGKYQQLKGMSSRSFYNFADLLRALADTNTRTWVFKRSCFYMVMETLRCHRESQSASGIAMVSISWLTVNTTSKSCILI